MQWSMWLFWLLPSLVYSFAKPIHHKTTSMEDAAAFNKYASAAVELSDSHVSERGLWTVTRTVRDIDQNKRRKYLYSQFIGDNAAHLHPPMPPVEIAESQKWRLPSPSGSKVAILHQEDEAVILEIWTDNGQTLLQRIPLPNKKQHGKVVCDPAGFGRPVWNDAETALVYLAERKVPETQSFFEKQQDDDDVSDDKKQQKKVVGGQNVLGIGKTEHWGEQYHEQFPLLDLFLVLVDTGNVRRVTNVPTCKDSTTTLGGFTLGQVVFHGKHDLIYVAWDAGGGNEMPRRLGLVYCQQRSSKLYRSSIRKLMENDASDNSDDEPCQCLTPDMRLARSPRLAPPDENGKQTLVFLGSEQGFDTHSGCWALYTLDWESKDCHVVLDQVWDPRSVQCKDTVSNLPFPGLFLQQLPESCFVSPQHLILTTQWGSTSQVVRVSMKDGEVMRLPCSVNAEDSSKLLCLTPDGSALVTTEAPNRPASISIMTSESSYQEGRPIRNFQPIAASRFSVLSSPISMDFSTTIDIREAPEVEDVKFDLSTQSLLLLPKETSELPPLIVVPHGGPHGASCTNFLPSYAFLCGHGGYAILMVNYRGSTGFGQASIESLPSNIGTLDVVDVIHATEQVRDSGLVDPARIGICGGSHGGFLTGHCTGQYPDLFRAAAMRNPVVNIPSMTTATDIPDWCFVEACGGPYQWSEYRPPTAAELASMRAKSPIAHVEQVQTPTLVALGLEDLRVPPSQGLEWYHTLRSRGVPTKLLTYEKDNHAIAGVQSEADHWIHIKQWFDKYLK